MTLKTAQASPFQLAQPSPAPATLPTGVSRPVPLLSVAWFSAVARSGWQSLAQRLGLQAGPVGAAGAAGPGRAAAAMQSLRHSLALGLVVALAACGGGGGGGDGGGSNPPPSGAPSIIGQPANVAVTAGQPANFSVNVTGTAPITYSWARNGVAIAGANAATYTLATTAVADSGAQFSVSVSNAQGSVTSTPATLTVSAAIVAPSFTSQPVNATVTAGQTATFSAAATGSGTLAYQWLRNGTAIAGATAASYTTPALSLADSGAVYTVSVSNSAGTATSAGALLTVNPVPVAPTITTQPAAQSVTAGQSAVFTVVAAGDPTLTYQWRRDGSNIAGATGATYTTPTTTLADNGANFTVEVRNAVGMVTSNNATLTVNPAPVAPSISTQPLPVSVLSGATATFSVAATGSGTLAYQWRRNGVAIVGANAASYTTGALAVADSGAQFSVVVSNSAGSVTSNTALLTVTLVTVDPLIVMAPQAQLAFVGQRASFSVTASGTGPLAYQWRRNGTPIVGATSMAYITPVTTLADNGANFDVVVSNSVGSITSPAVLLTVQAPVAANYWLRGDAGVAQTATLNFANGARQASPYNLTLVDPANVPATVVAEAGGSWLLLASSSDARANPQNSGDSSERFVVYARGTRLWRLDLLAGSGTPTPAQVSNASLGDLCASATPGVVSEGYFADIADAGSSVMQYRVPGTDAQCGTADDRFVAIRVNAASTAAPVDVPRLLVALTDSTGAISGYLARDGNNILRLNASFGAASTAFTVGAGEITLLRTPSGPGTIIFRDGNTLRAYNTASGTAPVNFGTAAVDFQQLGEVSSPAATAFYVNGGRILSYRLDNSGPLVDLLTLAAGQAAWPATRGNINAQQVLFVLASGGTSRIAAVDGAGTITNLVNESAVVDERSVGATPTRFVYTVDGGSTLRSAPRVGGTPLTLASSPQLRVVNFGSWAYESVWFDLRGPGGTLPGSALRVLDSDGGNPRQFADTTTVGGALFNGYTDTSVGRIIAQPIGSTAAASYSGATLLSLDAVTGATRVTYGTLAVAAYNVVDFSRQGPDRPALVSAQSLQSLGVNATDLYYVRVGTPGLVRLTNFVP